MPAVRFPAPEQISLILLIQGVGGRAWSPLDYVAAQTRKIRLFWLMIMELVRG
jgi:hypothetical protein